MNGTAFGTAARTVAIGATLVIAAALGLVVGNALNGVSAGAGPLSRTASAAFSIDALEALRATRGDAAPVEDYADYGLRHAAPVEDYVDYGLRH